MENFQWEDVYFQVHLMCVCTVLYVCKVIITIIYRAMAKLLIGHCPRP
jgi:hypothetical protein